MLKNLEEHGKNRNFVAFKLLEIRLLAVSVLLL